MLTDMDFIASQMMKRLEQEYTTMQQAFLALPRCCLACFSSPADDGEFAAGTGFHAPVACLPGLAPMLTDASFAASQMIERLEWEQTTMQQAFLARP